MTQATKNRTNAAKLRGGKTIAPKPREAEEDDYVPRTPLGRLLMEARREVIASGVPLLDWDDLEREVAERRGGAGDK